MTQNERILHRLKTGQLCAMEPLRWEPPITRVAARVNDLRNAGHDIMTAQPCHIGHREPGHHAAYTLADLDQGRLFA